MIYFFHLSKKWKGISEEIVIGLLQHLLIRILNIKNQKTIHIDLYDTFIKSLQKTTVNPVADEELRLSFERVNEQFFSETLQLPHMKWGRRSTTRLATYNHHIDTITVSSVLQGYEELLDFVVYHELLHKKLQYHSSCKRVRHHTAQFRKLERQFPGAERLEKELQRLG